VATDEFYDDAGEWHGVDPRYLAPVLEEFFIGG
jgi:hypothetical protein